MNQSKIAISGFDISTSRDSKDDYGDRNSGVFRSGKNNRGSLIQAPPIIPEKREQLGQLPVSYSQPLKSNLEISIEGEAYRREVSKLVQDRLFLMERSNRILYQQCQLFTGLEDQKLPLSILFSNKRE